MVPASTVAAICFTLILTLLGPVAVLLFWSLRHRKDGIVLAWVLGAAGFVILQLFIRIPLLNALAASPFYTFFSSEHFTAYCLVLAFTAGLFEGVGRLLTCTLLQKGGLNFSRSVAAGLGHGGIECMLLVGMSYINNLIYAFLINSGMFADVVAQTAAAGVDTAAVLSIQTALLETGAGMFLLAAYERVLTMVCHTALSVLVCDFAHRGKVLQGFALCVLFHTLLDSVVTLAANHLALVYAALTAFAVLAAWYLRYAAQHWDPAAKKAV